MFKVKQKFTINMTKLFLQRIAKTLFAFIVFCNIYNTSIAQNPEFYDEIQQFKKHDLEVYTPKNSILLIGSSSFTKWKDVQEYFPGFTIVNRGFGGSSLPDVIRYSDDIIFPYQPKQILIYCGENDLAASDTVTAKIVFDRFVQLFTIIRSKLPKVSIAYVSMKPSPSREHLLPKYIAGNLLIKNYLATKSKTAFIDVYSKMFTDGKIMKGIFLSDRLHMNAKGYQIWQKIIEPYLIK